MWERIRVQDQERRRRAREADRRRRIEESERCTLAFDDRVCARTPRRCPCRGSGRCGKPHCRTGGAQGAATRPAAARPATPTCGPTHACLAFGRDCVCAAPRACPYPQCMRIGTDLGEDDPPDTPPLAPRGTRFENSPDTWRIGIIRPLRARDFGVDRCTTPDHRSACRLGTSCPCVLSGMCEEADCGRAPE